MAMLLPLVKIAQSNTHPVKQTFRNSPIELARIEAVREGKMLFIDFTADWCLPCRYMDEHTFSDPQVSELLKRDFISVQYDIQSFDGVELKQKYSIKTLPTLIVISPDGTEIKRIQGSLSATALLDQLRELKDNFQYDKNPYFMIERPPLVKSERNLKGEDKSEYVLQLGLFRSKENCANKALSLSIKTKIVEITIEGETFYALVDLEKGSKEDILVRQEELKGQGIDCFIKQF
jgi:thiol-disulfide isomerase/thioredoxin